MTIEYLANHSDIASQLVANEGTIALLPQPFVTTVEMKDENVHVVVDLNEAWLAAENVDLPMGIIIGQEALLADYKGQVDTFLGMYEASIRYIEEDLVDAAALVEKHGIVASAKVAELAIPKCNITYLTAAESKDLLNTFYGILFEENPQAVGGTIPDEAFYSLD